MATTDEGKIDIGKLQLKLFAGPNGINVLNLVPGKSPTFPPKSPKSFNDTEVSETTRHELPTIKLDIDLNEDGDEKSDEERLNDDNVLSSLCKKRPRKPGARPPSRTFVKNLGTSSSNEEVTLLIDTKKNNPSLDIVDGIKHEGEIKLLSGNSYLSPSIKNNGLSPSINNNGLSPSIDNGFSATSVSQEEHVKSFPPVKLMHDDVEKQLNITLITKALQDRNSKKKENESITFENVKILDSPNKLNHLSVTDKYNDGSPKKSGVPPPVSPKPGRKKFNTLIDDQKITKPFDIIAKDQGSIRNYDNIEGKKKGNTSSIKEDDIKTRPIDQSILNSIHEQNLRKVLEKSNNETSKINTVETGKPVFLEIQGDYLTDKTTNEGDFNLEDTLSRSRSYTHSLKRPEINEQALNRTLSEGSRAPKTILKVDRSQSEIPTLKLDFESTKSQKVIEELSNKTYLELETLKNINQKANEKSQITEKLLDGRKLPTPRTFGSIENVSVKRYQRIETSDYFNYKKSIDDVRAKENEKISTDNEKNQSSDLFKSKFDVLKEARTRDRSNTSSLSDAKNNVMYVPYSTAGRRANSPEDLSPATAIYRSKSAGARSTEASLLPRFKGSSVPSSSFVTKSNMVKPCPSFPSRVLDRFMPKSTTSIETKRSNPTYS